MAIEVREHTPGTNIDAFVRIGYEIFKNDPAWVPPIELDLRTKLNPKKNPFFEHAEAQYFTAWKDGKLVGRASAQIDREHLRVHKDGAGFFGYWDTIDDVEVAKALLDKADQWVRARGMTTLRGPYSLTLYEEAGILINGFEHPPSILMGHSLPYQQKLAEACGLTKAKDLFAWRYDVHDLPRRCIKAWEDVQAMPEVKLRNVDLGNFQSELANIFEIFNEAWSENWGHVPPTDAEIQKGVKDLKLILDPELAFIAELNGRPVGICICVPNLNEAIKDLNGKLFPTGLLKILWRMKVKHPTSARLMMLGIRKELRGVKKYGGLSMAMYVELARRGESKGYRWGELSFTLEDNAPVNLGIRAMGGKIYKTYRVYERALT